VISGSLRIQDCLLDQANPRSIDGRTVGERIRAQGKAHLWGERVGGVVDTVVVHYISAINRVPERPFELDRLLEIMCDCGVSSHYLVTRRGRVLRLVPDNRRAWHCGGSIMPDPDARTGVNDFSIGIELAATTTSGYTVGQYQALSSLCRAIAGREGLPLWILGHEHIAGESAVRKGLRKEGKSDPGPLFQWHELAVLLGCGVGPSGIGLVLDSGGT